MKWKSWLNGTDHTRTTVFNIKLYAKNRVNHGQTWMACKNLERSERYCLILCTVLVRPDWWCTHIMKSLYAHGRPEKHTFKPQAHLFRSSFKIHIFFNIFFFFYVLILMMYSKRKDRYFIGHHTNHSVYMPQFFIWHWKMTLGMSPHKKKKKKVLIPQNHTSFVQSNWTTSLCLYVGVTSTLSHHSISPPVKSIFFFQQHQSVGQSLLSNPFSIDTVIRFIHYLSFL